MELPFRSLALNDAVVCCQSNRPALRRFRTAWISQTGRTFPVSEENVARCVPEMQSPTDVRSIETVVLRQELKRRDEATVSFPMLQPSTLL